MENKQHKYPDLQLIAEKCTTLEELWVEYIRALRTENEGMNNILYANKLSECFSIRKYARQQLEADTIAFQSFLEEWSKKRACEITIKRRLKDFVGLNKKIRMFLKDGKALDNIRDFVGFRLILKTDDPVEERNIKLCYELLNDVLKYFIITAGALLTEAEPIVDYQKTIFKPRGLIIPEKSGILPELRYGVKDYILHPKKNGYQSLHTVVKNLYASFEIQIRTKAMDIRAEGGNAHHGDYKKSRYDGVEIPFDLSKIHIDGVWIEPDGTIHDAEGLVKSRIF